MKAEEEFVTVNQAANLLGVKRQRVSQYITEGRLPSIAPVERMIPLSAVKNFQRKTRGIKTDNGSTDE